MTKESQTALQIANCNLCIYFKSVLFPKFNAQNQDGGYVRNTNDTRR